MITLAERVSAFINAEGHLTETFTSENSTTIRFRSRGLHYTATTMRTDGGYIQLSCATSIDEDVQVSGPLLRALWACQERYKCVKFSLSADDTVFACSVESYFEEPDGFQSTFWRAVSTIETALQAGMDEIRNRHVVHAAAEKFIEELTGGDAR